KQPAARRAERREISRRQCNGLDWLGQHDGGELLAQELREPLELARGRGELYGHIAARAVAMHERERESAHARLTRGEQTRELGKQASGGKNERRRLAHLGRQLELGAEALGWRKKIAR